MPRSRLIAAFASLSLLAGCGSTVTVHEGDGDGGSGASGSGSGSTSGSGGADSTGVSSGSGAGCGCAATEVCFEGECFAERMVSAGIVQVNASLYGRAFTQQWSPQAEPRYEVVAESGPCRLEQPTEAEQPGYANDELDVGLASVQINDDEPLSFTSFSGGVAESKGWPALDPAGGDTVTFFLSGGADVPAASTSVVMGPPITVPNVPTFSLGQPWTVAWESTELPNTLAITGFDDGQLSCAVDGDSVTVDGSLTSMITPINDSLDAWFIREDDSQKVDAGNGVILRAVAFRWEPFSVPVTP